MNHGLLYTHSPCLPCYRCNLGQSCHPEPNCKYSGRIPTDFNPFLRPNVLLHSRGGEKKYSVFYGCTFKYMNSVGTGLRLATRNWGARVPRFNTQRSWRQAIKAKCAAKSSKMCKNSNWIHSSCVLLLFFKRLQFELVWRLSFDQFELSANCDQFDLIKNSELSRD